MCGHPIEADTSGSSVWCLKRALPGLKGAPLCWGDHATKTLLEKHGLKQSAADECVYFALDAKNKLVLLMMRHMDDYVVTGDKTRVKPLLDDMGITLLVSGIQVLEKPGDKTRILGSEVERLDFGYAIRATKELIDAIVNDEGLDACRVGKVPAEKQPSDADLTPVDAKQHKHYRTQVGRLIYVAQHRSDLQHAVLRRSRSLAAPTNYDMHALHKLIRYLSGTKHLRQVLAPRGRWTITAHSDSDWAGGTDRKSCSGGVVFLGGAMVLSLSRVQQAVSTSSCEAELYALTTVCAEAMYLRSLLESVGLPMDPPLVYSDSSSALQVVGRRSVGKLKHVEVRLLALQGWQADHRVRTAKVRGDENAAGFLTKAVALAIQERSIKQVGLSML